MIGGVANTTAPETAKLCEQYLGPALRLLNFNNLPLPINPYLRPIAEPGRHHLHRSRSSRREVRGRAIRPSRRQRSRRTPAPEMCHRPPVTAAPACLPCRRACTGTTKCLRRRRPRSSRARRSRDRPTSAPGPRAVGSGHAASADPGACRRRHRGRCCLRKGCRRHDPPESREGTGCVGVLPRSDDDGLRLPGAELAAAARCGRSRARRGDLSPSQIAECRYAGVEFAGHDRRRRRRQRRAR